MGPTPTPTPSMTPTLAAPTPTPTRAPTQLVALAPLLGPSAVDRASRGPPAASPATAVSHPANGIANASPPASKPRKGVYRAAWLFLHIHTQDQGTKITSIILHNA